MFHNWNSILSWVFFHTLLILSSGSKLMVFGWTVIEFVSAVIASFWNQFYPDPIFLKLWVFWDFFLIVGKRLVVFLPVIIPVVDALYGILSRNSFSPSSCIGSKHVLVFPRKLLDDVFAITMSKCSRNAFVFDSNLFVFGSALARHSSLVCVVHLC